MNEIKSNSPRIRSVKKKQFFFSKKCIGQGDPKLFGTLEFESRTKKNERMTKVRYFPRELLGKIVLFFSSVEDYLRFVFLSKEIMEFFEENSQFSVNVIFRFRKKFVVRVKKYVSNLLIDSESSDVYKILKFFPNLTNLAITDHNFSKNSISKAIISSRSNNLKNLFLRNCDCSNIQLSHFQGISTLKLENCEKVDEKNFFVSSRFPLGGEEVVVKKLRIKKLIVKHCNGINGNFLKFLDTLQELSLHTNVSGINDFSFEHLGYLSNLRSLSLENFKIYKLNLPKGHEELKVLKLVNCNYYNFHEEFKELKEVRKVKVTYNDSLISEINLLSKNLQKITISHCKNIKNSSFKNFFPNLVSLSVDTNQNLDDTIFENVSNLGKLKLHFCAKFADAGFKNLKFLKHLKIELCDKITDAIFFHVGGSLQVLKINDCPKITNPGFVKLRYVREMCLESCDGVTDKIFHCLFELKRLTLVDCEGIGEFGLNLIKPQISRLKVSKCKKLDDVN